MKQIHASIPLLLLSVAIQDANATAIANPDTASMIQGSGSVAIDVLANDTSTVIETTDLFIQSFDANSAASGSVVLNEDNTLTYTPPDADYIGTDTFTYYVVDQSGYGGSATVTIEINESEPEPVPALIVPRVSGARNKAVAGMLEEACSAETLPNNLGSVCSQFSEDGDLNAIVAQIAPDEALIQRRLLAENLRNKTSRLYSSMTQLRAGEEAISVNNVVLPSGGAAGDELGSPWTVLSAIQIEDFERAQTANEAGYDYSAVGVMLGLGYRYGSNLNLGAAFDWTSYEVDFAAHGGDLNSDIYGMTGFLSWYSGPFSIDMQAGYSSGDTQAQRLFTFPAPTFADSDYGSSQWSLSTQAEWAWQSGAWALRPFLRLDYLSSEVEAFTETGNSIWLTNAAKQNYEQLDTSIGLDTSYTLTLPWGVMVPGVKLSLVNQADLKNDLVNFQLLDAGSAPGNFQLGADSADDLFYQWDVSSVMVFTNGVSSFISGRIVSSYDHTSAYQISGGVNWEF